MGNTRYTMVLSSILVYFLSKIALSKVDLAIWLVEPPLNFMATFVYHLMVKARKETTFDAGIFFMKTISSTFVVVAIITKIGARFMDFGISNSLNIRTLVQVQDTVSSEKSISSTSVFTFLTVVVSSSKR